jgi:ABC-type lipoprotein release transport system permease subunit
MNRLLMTQVWTDDAGFDPWVLAGCLATIVTLGFVASYLPALRATKVQPLAALRHE